MPKAKFFYNNGNAIDREKSAKWSTSPKIVGNERIEIIKNKEN